MYKRSIVSAAALLLIAPIQAQLEITYVANEGFLLTGGGKKVLVDALFDGGIGGYPKISPEMRPLLEQARAPFDGVNLVLATHFHGDHFGPVAVGRHLTANPSAWLVTTPQAVERLSAELRADPAIAGRIRAVYPEEGRRVELDEGAVKLEVLNLHHGRGREPPVQNLGFLIEIGGYRVLHVGDTEVRADDLRPYGLAKQQIDVALLPSWLLTHDDWAEAVRNEINPKQIIAMHFPTKDAPPSYFGKHRSYEARMKVLRDEFPDTIVLETPGASTRLEQTRK